MKTSSTTILAIGISIASGIAAISNDDRLALSGNPFMPEAGERPGEYRARVAEHYAKQDEQKGRQNRVASLQLYTNHLKDLIIQSKKLEVEISTGMTVPKKNEPPSTSTSLTAEEKISKVQEQIKLQEKILYVHSLLERLRNAIAEDEDEVKEEKDNQETQIRNREEIREEIRWQLMEKEHDGFSH